MLAAHHQGARVDLVRQDLHAVSTRPAHGCAYPFTAPAETPETIQRWATK